MIKIYGMPSCPDCSFVERQAEGRAGYEIIDIGSHVKFLKEFLRLRDSSPVFDDARHHGRAGIPCFVLEDGRVTLIPEEAGLKSRTEAFASAGDSGAGFDDGGASDCGSDTGSASSDPSGIGPSAGFDEGAACSLDGKGC